MKFGSMKKKFRLVPGNMKKVAREVSARREKTCSGPAGPAQDLNMKIQIRYA